MNDRYFVKANLQKSRRIFASANRNPNNQFYDKNQV